MNTRRTTVQNFGEQNVEILVKHIKVNVVFGQIYGPILVQHNAARVPGDSPAQWCRVSLGPAILGWPVTVLATRTHVGGLVASAPRPPIFPNFLFLSFPVSVAPAFLLCKGIQY